MLHFTVVERSLRLSAQTLRRIRDKSQCAFVGQEMEERVISGRHSAAKICLSRLATFARRQVLGLFNEVAMQTHDRQSGYSSEVNVGPITWTGLEKLASHGISKVVEPSDLLFGRIVIVLDEVPYPSGGVTRPIAAEPQFDSLHVRRKVVLFDHPSNLAYL